MQYEINLKELPKCWAVKNDNSQLFKDTVIKWVNEKYGLDWLGVHSAFYGVTVLGDADWFNCLYCFGKEVCELSLKQFILLTTKQDKPWYTTTKRMPGLVAGSEVVWVGDDTYQAKSFKHFFTEEEVLDTEFFKVGVDKISKGDYLYCHTNLVMDHTGEAKATKGRVYFSENDGCFTNNTGNARHSVPTYRCWFRKATPKEVEDNITITIGDCSLSFTESSVSVNGVVYDKVFIQGLVNMLESASAQIKSLNVGCSGQYKLDLPKLREILSRM